MILSKFQERAIESIKEDKNVLITAHTGSGKTLPAIFAIEYFLSRNKKVIYTSPIKALSNQKFNEFSSRFNNTGILTGDIKHNPDGDLLIMTTEILKNKLLKVNTSIDFDIDIENELGCVIFDEIHYINDKDRGYVWENCIMLLPDNVILVMLSATIGNPEYFSEWISKIKGKEVTICSTNERVVPLKIYKYTISSEKTINSIKDKEYRKKIIEENDRLSLIKDNNELVYSNIDKMNYYVDGQSNIYVINELCRTLRLQDMYPALIFVFSRKAVENIAININISLYDEGEKDINISGMCKQLLVSKVSNWKEYVILSEYDIYIKLFEKGIGIHHAGMLPIFREIVEILYERRILKLLIATETFAIGLNMPTKTVCFTSLFKHDGNKMRFIYNNEFTQMAGRAGRRNIDKIGNVVILPNLYRKVTNQEYYNLLISKNQNIKSKFRIDYTLLLTIEDTEEYIKKSFMYCDIINEINSISNNIELLNKDYNLKLKKLKNFENTKKYYDLDNRYMNSNGNRRKSIRKEMKSLDVDESDINIYKEIILIENNIRIEIDNKRYASGYISDYLSNIKFILYKNNYITEDGLTDKGRMFSMINEINPFIFCDFYELSNGFESMEGIEIISFFSYFYEMEYECEYSNDTYKEVIKIIDRYLNIEQEYSINLTNVRVQCIMYKYINKWLIGCTDENECKRLIIEYRNETSLHIGEFIKCCLKIVHICNEVIYICDKLNNLDLKNKLDKNINRMMKYIISNTSLYV